MMALLWRGILLNRGVVSFSRWLLIGLVIACLAIVVLSYGGVNGRDPGSALLVSMLVLKLCEAKTYRDGMVVVLLGYFVAAVNFLFTQSIPTALWMLVQVILITFVMMQLQQQGRVSLPLPQLLKGASRYVLMALPLMAILFALFPRIPGPLWGLPTESNSARTGFSDSLSLDNFSQLALSGAVAFRVQFDGAVPPPAERYWRGVVLWRYDGSTWRGRDLDQEKARSKAPRFDYQDTTYRYQVTLEPHSEQTVFGLDMPIKHDGVHFYDADYELSMERDVTQVIQYRAESAPRYRIQTQLPYDQIQLGLSLPRSGNPQSRALAQRWRREYAEQPQKIIETALQRFRQQPYYYTLRPPPLGQHSLDDFLFNTKRGFCEHYASSFVFLMRAAGIPARIIIGYQGGEMNPYDDFMTVRQSDAHAWAEVWIEGSGWVRIDPTAAVAPDRIELGVEDALGLESGSLPFQFRSDSLLRDVVRLWDAVDNRWNQWVLGYDSDFQKDFLERFGLDSVRKIVITLFVLFGLTLAAVLLWGLRSVRSSRRYSDVERDYRRFCDTMEKRQLARWPHEGAEDYAERLARALPQHAALIHFIGKTYNRLEYGTLDEALAERFHNACRRARQEIKTG
ncbi:transglutaminase domain protein [gamma proteobacterium HTCC5015]|nr:transglutaminase domain protein [gamma proteobacterium HTCC5015]